MAIPTADIYPGTPGTPLYAGRVTPGLGGLVTSFVLENWNAGGSTAVLWRGGMPFKKGDVPAGQALEIRRGGVAVAAQFDERSTWSDGSLKFAVCHMRDTTLAASASNTYEIYAVAGSFNNAGATSLATVAASEALTVEISSLTQFNGTTNVTRGAGAALGSFATHAAVATRVTKIHSGPVCDGWQVWGMVKDGAAGAGAEDAHLKCIWYVDAWKDAGGAVIDVEHAVEMAQDWFTVAAKFRLDYTATLKRGATTVQAYTGVQHPYHGHWFTARLQNDNNHGKRHWVSAIPTLLYKPSKSYWSGVGVMPGLDATFNQTIANPTFTYVPLDGLGHRFRIDDSGGYSGRGMVTNYDAIAFMRQTATDTRSARVAAFAGLHIPRHYRDDRTRTRTSESADVANTTIPFLLDPKPSSASTFAGMPAPKYASSDGRTNSLYLGAFEFAQGGEGPWSSTGDSAHAVNYTAYIYMLEGERYMLETAIDMASKSSISTVGNEYGSRPGIHWAFSALATSEMSIPATRYSGISDFFGQERSLGFSALLLGYAAALIPDNDVQAGYLRAWNSHNADYLNDCITFMPPSLKAAGAVFTSGDLGAIEVKSPWMIAFIVQGCAQNYLATEVAGFKAYGDMAVKGLVAMHDRAPYDMESYRTLLAPKRGTYSASNPWFTAAEVMILTGATVSANRLTLNSGGGAVPLYSVQNGDRIKFSVSDAGFGASAIPPEYPEETIFYAVNASGAACDLSLTNGGSAVTLTAGSYSIGYRCFGGASITAAAFPPYLPNADSYSTIAEATFAYAERAGMASCPAGKFAAQRAFLINVNRTPYPAWRLQL